MPDFIVTNNGSISLVTPMNANSTEHLKNNVGDDALWMNVSLAVEYRYINDLIDGLQQRGYTVEEA